MKVYQILIHYTEYWHGYKDDVSWTNNGPTYNSKALANKAKDYLNRVLPNNDDLFGVATICEIDVLDHFSESQLKIHDYER